MPIQLTDLTNGSIKREAGTQPVWEGTAIFDTLIKAVNENINIQYEQTRITGSDYATVYLGAIETCIKEATNLLLQKAIVDKDIELKDKEIAVKEKEIEVQQAQILKLQADTLNTQEDTKLKTAQADVFPLQAAQELALTTEKVLSQEEDTKLKAAQAIAFPLQSAKDLAVKDAQINVAVEETRLKAAQADAYPNQVAKDNLVKQANIDLLNRQKEGFDDNKNQKLFESQMNAWALMFSSGLLETKPAIINNDAASSLYNTLKPQ